MSFFQKIDPQKKDLFKIKNIFIQETCIFPKYRSYKDLEVRGWHKLHLVQGMHFSQSKNARLLNLTHLIKIDTSINLCANSEPHVYPNDENWDRGIFSTPAKQFGPF